MLASTWACIRNSNAVSARHQSQPRCACWRAMVRHQHKQRQRDDEPSTVVLWIRRQTCLLLRRHHWSARRHLTAAKCALLLRATLRCDYLFIIWWIRTMNICFFVLIVCWLQVTTRNILTNVSAMSIIVQSLHFCPSISCPVMSCLAFSVPAPLRVSTEKQMYLRTTILLHLYINKANVAKKIWQNNDS